MQAALKAASRCGPAISSSEDPMLERDPRDGGSIPIITSLDICIHTSYNSLSSQVLERQVLSRVRHHKIRHVSKQTDPSKLEI